MHRADRRGHVLKYFMKPKNGDNSRFQKYNACAKICKALGNPVRIHITEFLQGEARCVHEIAEELGIGMSTVSRHLDILRNAGLVNTRKEGRFVYYTLRSACASRIIAYIVANRGEYE